MAQLSTPSRVQMALQFQVHPVSSQVPSVVLLSLPSWACVVLLVMLKVKRRICTNGREEVSQGGKDRETGRSQAYLQMKRDTVTNEAR